ncbi:class I SAM-dependent methyltransferase [Candidatus Parcubacteria bacterium]|nr:class I SAM-dependent methyltransferase [Candidatus Parcubacteria bacterium]
MENKKTLGNILSGKNREAIPNIAFHVMTYIMKLMDFFGEHYSKNFETLGLKPGQTVIDYGCGPARYIENASKTVGELGKVIAVDIHPLAIKNVKTKIEKCQLKNVEAILARGYSTQIDSKVADVVYALDMFHMIHRPNEFLKELSRLTKDDGIIIIEDGHQSRNETKQKIESVGILSIIEETKLHVKCKKYEK